jgi:hypothetical protein
MSFLRLLPQVSVPPIEPRSIDKPFLVEQFIGRLKAHLAKMQRNFTENEELDVIVGFSLPVTSMEVVGYANPALVTLDGREQGSGRPARCWLIDHRYRSWSR